MSLWHSDTKAILLLIAWAALAEMVQAQEAIPTGIDYKYPLQDKNQLDLVLLDRPSLQTIVRKGSSIWNWLALAFSDTNQGVHIYWDSSPTSKLHDETAETIFPDGATCAYIRVDGNYKTGPFKGFSRPPEAILSDLVFELNNSRQWGENKRISLLVETGQIKRNDYIVSCARSEYVAEKETVHFYMTEWLPFCQSTSRATTPKIWHVPITTTFGEWLSRYPHDYWYPWKYYGNRFDWISNQRKGDFKLKQGDLDGAIAEYTQAISLGSRSYFWRGMAEMLKNDWDHSITDLEQAQTLSHNDQQNEDYTQIFLWIIRSEKGQKAMANNELDIFLQNRTNLQDTILVNVERLFLDRQSEKDFLDYSFSSDPNVHLRQQCVVWYFIGVKRLVGGDKLTAVKYFQKCSITNVDDSAEYTLATAQLKALRRLP